MDRPIGVGLILGTVLLFEAIGIGGLISLEVGQEVEVASALEIVMNISLEDILQGNIIVWTGRTNNFRKREGYWVFREGDWPGTRENITNFGDVQGTWSNHIYRTVSIQALTGRRKRGNIASINKRIYHTYCVWNIIFNWNEKRKLLK